MYSYFFLGIVAAAISLFVFFRKFRSQRDNKEIDDSPSSPLSSLSHNWTHEVFPSFRGEDVRRDFLSHILDEFQRKGITPFIDNEIKRGEFIGRELRQAIRGSKIAIVLLSKNYASSSWCLDELAEIMNCKDKLVQTVMVVFYKVDPSDVKKLAGDFGKVFKKTCGGKKKEDIERWRQALEKVAKIAGYDSRNWDNETAMIRKIATDISNMLNNSTASSNFDGLVGMRAHLDKMKPLLNLDADEVRTIGILGPSGIGKTTIARVAYHQLSNSFQLIVFMENFKDNYTRPCSDDYSTKLHLQQKLLSQITNQKNIEIPHLGVVRDRLKDKKVLVVLDSVDHLVQLDAMAKEIWWFGPGSRIIITTQYQNLLRAHGINHIYKVNFPAKKEALQILCMNAFGQKYPKYGFEKLALEVTRLAGQLPLGLRVMGSYFRGMSKQEWNNALPKLRTSINTEIESILKFSYDALDDEYKDLFLHIACFFNGHGIVVVEEYLAKKFLDVRQGLNVLAEKCLISINPRRMIKMHNLLAQLGRDIVRRQFVHEPGQCQFLIEERDISELLTDDAAGSRSVIGINFNIKGVEEKINISERAFEGMSNLQFLRVSGDNNTLALPRGLDYLSHKLRLLHWTHFPMTCFPSTVNLKFVVHLNMRYSKLEKLWEGIKPLSNLRRINLSDSANLKELPDLSTATNLQKLDLRDCSKLVKLPSSIGYTNNLQELNLRNCSSLVSLPSCIGNATNLEKLYLDGCSSLVEFPSCIGNATNLKDLDLRNWSSLTELPVSIGNLQKLKWLRLKGCSKLEVLPTNINLESLNELDLTDCSMLKMFPEISTNIKVLKLSGTAVEKVSLSIKSWSGLYKLHMPYSEGLGEFPHALEIITELYLSDTEIQELPPWVKRISRLNQLVLKGCRKLVSLPQIPDSLSLIDAQDCESLERLDCSFHSPKIRLKFSKCFKLNQEARDLIIHRPNSDYVVLPGGKVPACFTHRATNGGSLTIKLNQRPLPTSMRFKACVLLVRNSDDENCIHRGGPLVACNKVVHFIHPLLTEHLYIFEVEPKVNSGELFFEFKLHTVPWKIGECGVLQLSEVPSC